MEEFWELQENCEDEGVVDAGRVLVVAFATLESQREPEDEEERCREVSFVGSISLAVPPIRAAISLAVPIRIT